MGSAPEIPQPPAISPTSPRPGLPAPPDDARRAAAPSVTRVPWRAAGVGLSSLATTTGTWVAAPLLGQIVTGLELAVALAVIGTALFGSPELSERAFRLLRWIANRPEPPAPAHTTAAPPTRRAPAAGSPTAKGHAPDPQIFT